MIDTPVAFLIFNRPDLTEVVFNAIAQAQPKKLLVVADGPRFPDEVEKCQRARSIVESIDWDCEVMRNYSDVNLGCKLRLSTGLGWVFEQCEEAIILEDDCLPDPSFFPFCAELLERYRTDQRVMAISGDNFQRGIKHSKDSYYFSAYNHVWGWASWRRAWQWYDVEMRRWPELRESPMLSGLFSDSDVVSYWRAIFDSVHAGAINTWDYQWTFACWAHNGLTALPNVNLVSNVGFGADSTHTSDASNWQANLAKGDIGFPLRHPPTIARDVAADAFTTSANFGLAPPSLKRAVIKRLPKAMYRVARTLGAHAIRLRR